MKGKDSQLQKSKIYLLLITKFQKEQLSRNICSNWRS